MELRRQPMTAGSAPQLRYLLAVTAGRSRPSDPCVLSMVAVLLNDAGVVAMRPAALLPPAPAITGHSVV